MIKPFVSIRLIIILAAWITISGCGAYRFSDIGTLPPDVRTVRVNFIENRAPYINPLLSPNLTDRIKQRITSQTRLTSVSGDNAHWEISGTITDYSVTTTGVQSQDGRQQSTINRLNVTVHIILNRTLENKVEEFDISRNFDFSANQSLQAAEANLLDDIVRNLTDEIFNRIFSNW